MVGGGSPQPSRLTPAEAPFHGGFCLLIYLSGISLAIFK